MKNALKMDDINTAVIEKREVNGCKVNLYFSAHSDENRVDLVLENLLISFDKKIKAMQGCT